MDARGSCRRIRVDWRTVSAIMLSNKHGAELYPVGLMRPRRPIDTGSTEPQIHIRQPLATHQYLTIQIPCDRVKVWTTSKPSQDTSM